MGGDTKGSAEAFPEQVLAPSFVKFLFQLLFLLFIISHLFAGLALPIMYYHDTVLYLDYFDGYSLLFKPTVLYSFTTLLA